MKLTKEQQVEVRKLLERWQKEANAAEKLAVTTPRSAPNKEVAIELRTQFQTAERTYENCMRDLKRLFEME